MTNKEFCIKYGYTMTELAKLCGVARTVLYDMDAKRYHSSKEAHILATRKALARLNRPNYILPVILWLILLIMLVLL